VLNTQLAGKDHVAGGAYSIADIAIFGWANRHARHEIEIPDYPNVQRWYEAMKARPAVSRGLAAAEEPTEVPELAK
jgi:GST-like protein